MKIYYTDETANELTVISDFRPGSWIDLVNPTEEEIETIVREIGVKRDFIHYIMDEEEQPRVEIADDQRLIFIDVPIEKKKTKHTIIQTVPLAILLVRDEYVVTFSLRETLVLQDFKASKVKEFYTAKKSRFLIQVLFRVAVLYQRYLKTVSDEIETTEDSMVKATKNQDLEKLLTMEKSLVYIMTSLKSNEVVLEKIMKGNIVPLYEADTNLLEDAIIENQQALDMAILYREILGSMTDSFATIISNNLNGIMKFLAGITIVISIPTMVASFMGMNVPLGMFQTEPVAFWILIGVSIMLSIIVAIILKKKNML